MHLSYLTSSRQSVYYSVITPAVPPGLVANEVIAVDANRLSDETHNPTGLVTDDVVAGDAKNDIDNKLEMLKKWMLG
jgi:hypothetical protein